MIKNGFRPEIEMQASDRFTGALKPSGPGAKCSSMLALIWGRRWQGKLFA